MDRGTDRTGERGPPLGLRQIVVISAVALAAMAVMVAGALVVLTTNLHDASIELRNTVRAGRLAREAQVFLLEHDRAQDASERARLEREIQRKLVEAYRHASAEEARQATDEIRDEVERHLAVVRDQSLRRGPTTLIAALGALDSFVEANVIAGEDVRARVDRIDRLANVIGGVAVVSMFATLAFLVVWIRSSVVRPMLELSDAMDRFGRGDLGAHATPSGAAELRRMIDRFNAMSQALARQHRARLEHLAGVAHDLRNPLAALQMSTALVGPEHAAHLDEPARRAFGIVQRQVGRLSRMVDDLLEVARIDAGGLSLVFADVDLRSAVRAVVELFEGTSDAHTIRVELPDEPLMIQADALRIEQTLTNLVSNAIKYSPRGGEIRIVAWREGDAAMVAVTDHGIGIDPTDLAHIWEPFRRTGLSNEAIPGVGLGLFTAQRIATAHGGKVTAQSTVGEGSTFTLALPLAERRSRDDG